MKYAIVIPDGCADEPQQSLGGKTPLQAAHTPAMDEVASTGLVGRANHVPASLPAGSAVANMSLLGYNPLENYTGRAPLEAAAQGIELGPEDWAVRCNLVTVEDQIMRDFTAGHISTGEATDLLKSAQAELVGDLPLEFIPGVSYRNLMLYRGGADVDQGASHAVALCRRSGVAAPAVHPKVCRAAVRLGVDDERPAALIRRVQGGERVASSCGLGAVTAFETSPTNPRRRRLRQRQHPRRRPAQGVDHVGVHTRKTGPRRLERADEDVSCLRNAAGAARGVAARSLEAKACAAYSLGLDRDDLVACAAAFGVRRGVSSFGSVSPHGEIVNRHATVSLCDAERLADGISRIGHQRFSESTAATACIPAECAESTFLPPHDDFAALSSGDRAGANGRVPSIVTDQTADSGATALPALGAEERRRASTRVGHFAIGKRASSHRSLDSAGLEIAARAPCALEPRHEGADV